MSLGTSVASMLSSRCSLLLMLTPSVAAAAAAACGNHAGLSEVTVEVGHHSHWGIEASAIPVKCAAGPACSSCAVAVTLALSPPPCLPPFPSGCCLLPSSAGLSNSPALSRCTGNAHRCRVSPCMNQHIRHSRTSVKTHLCAMCEKYAR